ncbi:MAG: right-handed parallel beta-helix repeat-containing protein [Phycisphaerales bacterium]
MNWRVFTAVGVLLQMCLLFAPTVKGRTIYVDVNAVGADNGSSWGSAFAYLQKGLSVANSGDEIRVAQGIYRPNQYGSAWSARPKPAWYTSFQLGAGVTLRGGFAGPDRDDPNECDPQRYVTILSGDINGNDVDGWGVDDPGYASSHSDNRARVVVSFAVESDVVLDGFLIESAMQNALYNAGARLHVVNCGFRRNLSWENGAAIRCEGGELILSDCAFEDNAADDSGGAVYASNATLSLSNCSFVNNEASEDAGAIYAWTANITLSACSFVTNGSSDDGGAISVRSAHLELSDCRFANNWTTDEGGAIYGEEAELVLTGCTFTGNVAHPWGWGGAIYQWQGASTFVACGFEGNAADWAGGAVCFWLGDSASMIRCTFRQNCVTESGGSGAGGAIVNYGAPLVLDACTFSGNRAESGGAIHASGSSSLSDNSSAAATVITHCTFVGNYASDLGGALRGYPARFTISNCTFADNEAKTYATLARESATQEATTMENCIVWDGPDSIRATGGTTTATRRGEPSGSSGPSEPTQPIIHYCDIEGGWPGEGNIDADPCFARRGHWVDAADPNAVVETDDANAIWVEGDYHLKSQAGRWDPQSLSWIQDDVTSPCIDAGDPSSPVAEEPEPNGGRVNMGAYGGTAEASKSL